jgi:hypothetical protein
MFYCAKRISDGVLSWVDETPQADTEAVINQAAGLYGGSADDWTFQELTPEQAEIVRGSMPARSKLVGGVLSSATPISLTLSAGTVLANGAAQITLTVDCHDLAYIGAVSLKITNPSGVIVADSDNAVAGEVEFLISTEIVGVHRIEVETVLHGVGFDSFEGV